MSGHTNWSQIEHKGKCNAPSPVHAYRCKLEPDHEGPHECGDTTWGHHELSEHSVSSTGRKYSVSNKRYLGSEAEVTRQWDDDDAVGELEAPPGPRMDEEILYHYPFQESATLTLTEFINSHINAMRMTHFASDGQVGTYRHDAGPECKHCFAKLALDHLNLLIQRQYNSLQSLYHRDERRLDTIQSLREDLAKVSKERNQEAIDARIREDVVRYLKEESVRLREERNEAYRTIQQMSVERHDESVKGRHDHRLGRIAAHVMDNPDIAPRDRNIILGILDER